MAALQRTLTVVRSRSISCGSGGLRKLACDWQLMRFAIDAFELGKPQHVGGTLMPILGFV